MNIQISKGQRTFGVGVIKEDETSFTEIHINEIQTQEDVREAILFLQNLEKDGKVVVDLSQG